jgi:hypothetical protein
MAESLSITTNTGAVITGELHCLDPVTHAVVVKDSSGAYTKISGDLGKASVPNPRKLGLTVQLDDNKIRDREMKSMVAAEKELDSLNFEVDPQTQQLFDRMRNIFPCRWQGVEMILFDSLSVAPPYDAVKVRNGGNDDGMERVKKVLAGERKKLGL